MDDTGTAARDSGGGDTSAARSTSLPYGERAQSLSAFDLLSRTL